MKVRILTAIIFFLLSLSVTIWGDRLVVKGNWGNGTGLRSSIPEAPEASVEGNTLSLYFADALSGLTVCVTNQNGILLYQATISTNGNSNYWYEIPIPFHTGTYRLLMTHTYGYITGEFTIR